MMIFFGNLRCTASLGSLASTLDIWERSTVIGPILTHGRRMAADTFRACVAQRD